MTDEAYPLLEEAIELGNRYKDDWPQDLAKAYQLMGDLHRQIGDFEESRSLLLQAEEILEDLEGHWNLYAESRSNRSYVERLEQNYDKAIDILEPISEEIQSQQNPDLHLKTNILNFLSGYYADVGRLQEADELRDINIDIIEELEGSESLNYGINLTNSLHLKYNLGQFEETEERARTAISIYNNIYDEPTGVLSVTYGALAASRLYSGQFDEALATLETAIDSWASVFDIHPDQWQVPDIYRGLMLAQIHHWEEAADKLLDNRGLFDQGHHTMYYTIPEGILAEALCRTGRMDEGNTVLRELEDNSSQDFQNPVYQSQFYEARARCHYEAGNMENAMTEIEKSIQAMSYPGRAMERSERKQLHASILTELGYTSEAIERLEEAEQIFHEIGFSDHPMLTNVVANRQELVSQIQDQ